MKFWKSEEAEDNYVASVIRIKSIKDHPDADRLQIVEVFGNEIIVAKDQYKVDDVAVYFPIESSIDSKFLSWANLFDKPELNMDQKSKGFFSAKGCRVKAVKLRGVPSQGFIYPWVKFSEFVEYYFHENTAASNDDSKVCLIGLDFDMINDFKLLKKYIPKGTQKVSEKREPTKFENFVGKFPRVIRKPILKAYNRRFNKKPSGIKSQIVEDYFHFHYKTNQLGKSIHTIQPEDEIVITSKLHGTSAIYSMPKVKKNRTLWDRIKYEVGYDIPDYEYKLVYASRSTIKNRKDGTYTDDVWGEHAPAMGEILFGGVTVYGEIVGYTPTGKCIQKGYDYGCKPMENKFLVYRITFKDGDEYEQEEVSWEGIEEFCEVFGLEHVPVYYKGRACDLFSQLHPNEEWNGEFLELLKDKFLDKPDEICKNDVVREGVVLRNESSDIKPAFKFKSPEFVLKETASRDKGEVDMEEQS